MKHYLVRIDCSYSRMVYANSPDEAIAQVQEEDVGSWDQVWSDMEIDEDFEQNEGEDFEQNEEGI
jgi:hypothetical protein